MKRERQWLACALAAAVLVAAGSYSVGRPARAAVPGGIPVQAAGPHRLFLPFALQSVVPHLVRIGQLGGATYAVAYAEPYVYVASGPRLLTVDVADSTSPRIVGHSDVLPGYVSDIDPAGEYLLVEVQVDANQGDDLLVVDVSDPRQPVVAGAIPLAQPVVECAVVGTRAYIATSDGTLLVFDVSDPIQPSAIGRASFGDHIVGLAAGPRFVVTTSYLDDIEIQTDRVLDVADPAHIVAVASWLRGDFRPAPAFAFVGDHLYAARPSGLTVLAPPDFAPVFEMGDVPGTAIAVHGSNAYVLGQFGFDRGPLAVFDVSQPERPMRVDACEPPTAMSCRRIAAGDLAAAPGWLFVTGGPSGEAGMRLVDVRDAVHPTVAGSVSLVGPACGGIWYDDEALLVFDDPAQAIRMFDVSSPDRPAEVGIIPGVWRSRLAVQDGVAYMVGSGGDWDPGEMEIHGVRSPEGPLWLGGLSWDDHRQLIDVAWQGDVALVAAAVGPVDEPDRWHGEVAVLDTIVPTTPVQVALLGPFERRFVGLAMSDGFGYVVTEDYRIDGGYHPHTDVGVVDVRVPADARLVGEVTVDGEVTGAEVWRGALYLTSFLEAAGDYVVDVREPARPTVVGQTGARHEPGWVHAGSYAFAATSPFGGDSLSVLDLSDPLRPLIVGRFADLSNPSAVAGDGEHIYVADCSGGLKVLRVER